MAHVTKSNPVQSKVTSKEAQEPKSNLEVGFGIFKDKIISKPSSWSADLRRTVK
ncbi:hypothetical protein GO730_39110 [Spirosoma sp. HMF3257]|uniref:hypothetical protein n=1 Tax=Spirosoma telluris TaxID=2183553 RepID=UPI0012F8E97C|nr:hypothetical protein [Spirosoma telluris]